MNFKKSLTWALTSTFLLVSTVSAEPPKGDKDAGKTAARLAKYGDAGPAEKTTGRVSPAYYIDNSDCNNRLGCRWNCGGPSYLDV